MGKPRKSTSLVSRHRFLLSQEFSDDNFQGEEILQHGRCGCGSMGRLAL